MKQLLCAASLCLLPSVASAVETLGTFFDVGATQTSTTVSPTEVFPIHFIAQDVPVGIGGYEFTVNMPLPALVSRSGREPLQQRVQREQRPLDHLVELSPSSKVLPPPGADRHTRGLLLQKPAPSSRSY